MSNFNQRPDITKSSLDLRSTSSDYVQSDQDLENVSNQFLFTNKKILPPDNYNSPYYIPFKTNEEPKPIEKLINRFTIWKMIIKQLIFYFKEISIFKKQTYLGNKAMLENLELLKKQTSGKLKLKNNQNIKNLKQSLSSTDLNQLNQHTANTNSASTPNLTSQPGNLQEGFLNKFIQSSFLPVGDLSILSISTTLSSYHGNLAEKELITHNQLTLKIIPRLENLKESLNETIKQISSLKNSNDFKTKDLKFEIAKTGSILADYMESVELLTKGETQTSLGTSIKFTKLEPKRDPYLLRLKLDLQLKDQLYTEAHLKESYYDVQHKGVQLESILYKEVQTCVKSFVTLINSELDSVKDNLVSEFLNGFLSNDYGFDWDYFIMNDDSKNLLNINTKDSLTKNKQIRKKSDVLYPYQKERISSCIISGPLEKKSKYLKNYSKFFYVLTFNFIHEFRTDDRKKERNPLNSYSLNDIKVAPSTDDPKKFIVRINSSNENGKAKYTFKASTEEVAAKWIDHLTDLCALHDPLERNSPQNGLYLTVQSQTQSMANLQSFNSETASLLRDDISSILLTPKVSTSSIDQHAQPNSQLQSQLYNNLSSSSLHLPSFHSVKPLQESEIPMPHQHRKVSSISSLSALNSSSPQALHKVGTNSTSSPCSDGTNSSVAMSPNYVSTNTATKIIISPGSTASTPTDEGDYFNYVAPRPKSALTVSATGSINSVPPPVRSTSPQPPIRSASSPSSSSIRQPFYQRPHSPVYRGGSPPMMYSGTMSGPLSPSGSFASSTSNNQQQGPPSTPQKVTIKSQSTSIIQPSSTSSSTASLSANTGTGTGTGPKVNASNNNSLTNSSNSLTGLVRGREKLQAQLKKAALSSNQNQQNNINGVFLQFAENGGANGNTSGMLNPRASLLSNLPQTPGFLPSNSIGDVFPTASTASTASHPQAQQQQQQRQLGKPSPQE